MIKFQQMSVTHIRICTFLQLQKLGNIMLSLDLRGRMRKSHALALETEGETAPGKQVGHGHCTSHGT